VVLYIVIPKGLLPEQDTGLITGVVQADQNIAFPQMEQRTKAVAEALRSDPAVTGVAAFIGAGSMNPTLNQGQLSIVLKERGDRDGLEDILPRLQKAVAGIPGVALYLKPVQDVTLDTRVAATEYQYSLSDVDSAQVALQATRLTEALRQRPELADVDNNLSNQGRALELNIDRDKASVLGVPMQTIDDTLYDAFGQRQISTIFTELNQYRVVLEVAPEFRTSTALMNQLAVASNGAGALTGSNATNFGQVTSSNSSTATGIGAQNTGIPVGAGNIIPLAALAEGKVTSTPLVVSHQQQLPAVTVSFNIAPGYSLSDAVKAIEETRASLDVGAFQCLDQIGQTQVVCRQSSAVGVDAVFLDVPTHRINTGQAGAGAHLWCDDPVLDSTQVRCALLGGSKTIALWCQVDLTLLPASLAGLGQLLGVEWLEVHRPHENLAQPGCNRGEHGGHALGQISGSLPHPLCHLLAGEIDVGLISEGSGDLREAIA